MKNTHTSYEKVMGRITNWKQVSNRASANCTCCGRIPKIQRLRYECRDTANMWRRSRSILVFRGWMFFCLAFVCIPSPVVQRNPVTFTPVSTMPTECVLSTKYRWTGCSSRVQGFRPWTKNRKKWTGRKKIDHLLKWTIFYSKKTICSWYWGPGAKIKELFALIHQSFETFLHESDKEYVQIGPIGYHRVRTDFPNLVYERDFSQFQRKSLSFPPKKKQTKREGTRTLETLGPTARSHPKRRWWHKRSAAVYRHPMERNQWRRYQIQPLFPSEHKGPLMFLREFLLWKKVRRFVFCWGGGAGCGRCWEVVVWGRM